MKSQKRKVQVPDKRGRNDRTHLAMDSANSVKIFSEKLAAQISESDLDKVAKGTHELSVKLVKKRPKRSDRNKLSGVQRLSETQKKDLFSRLYECTSREEGHAAVSEALKNKRELEEFAKYIDAFVMKGDRVAAIQKEIVEATVGSVLRSCAIQGIDIRSTSSAKR